MLRPTIYIPSRLTMMLATRTTNQGEARKAQESAGIALAQLATPWWLATACPGTCGG